jgi:hypothetical protein
VEWRKRKSKRRREVIRNKRKKETENFLGIKALV